MMRCMYVFIISLCAMILVSCVKDSEIDLPEVEDVMTLNLIISPTDEPFAVLTNSVNLGSENSISDILNANVVLYTGDKYLDTFHPEEYFDSHGLPRTGYRFPNLIPEEANEFNIRISATGFPDIDASTRTVEKTSSEETIRLDSITLTGGSVEFQSRHAHFTLGFRDNDMASNYYHVIVYEEAFRKDEMTGEWIPLRFKNPVYFFRNDLNLEDDIISNDRHGYLLYSTLNGILINDEFFNSDYYSIQAIAVLPSGGIFGPDGHPVNHKVFVKMYAEFRTVNEDYYKYYRSIALQQENADNPFAEPVIIHSNVNGGLGAMSYYTAVTADTVYVEY